MINNNSNKILKWLQFSKERFEPFGHLTMILVFVMVHIFISKSTFQINLKIYPTFILFIATTIFYFKLRLYDEVKDYELDVVINKHRPLPRGLLNHRDMYQGILVCIILELALFATQGLDSFISMVLTIIYSLIMFKEFFIKEKIRPHLTTYAILHTIVTSFLSIAIFSNLAQKSFFEIIQNKNCLYFAVSNWMVFNLFEFGRKTFAQSEERNNVDSYSSLFGKRGASLLVLSQAIIAHFLIFKISNLRNNFLEISHATLFLMLAIISFQFVLSNEVKYAQRFRLMCSLYIIVFYLTIAISYNL